jgi:hypothetical protein
MKHTLYILSGLLLAGCVCEDLSDCPPEPSVLHAKAVLLRVRDAGTKADITDEVLASLADADPDNDMIRDVGFYTFNTDGTLRGTYIYATPDLIQYPLGFLTGGTRQVGEDGISDAAAYVSAWANVTHEYIDDPHNTDGDGDGLRAPCEWLDYRVGSALTDPIWGLTQDPRDPAARMCPGEIWFGLTDMLAPPDPSNPLLGQQRMVSQYGDDILVNIVNILWIEAKNALLSVEARGLPDDGSQYYFLVRNQNSGYEFNGDPIADNVQVYLDGVFDPATGHFTTTTPQNMIHSLGNQAPENSTVIDLYRRATTRAEGDLLIASTENTLSGVVIDLNSGQETHVVIESGGMEVTVTYRDWRDKIVQNAK